MRDSRLPPTPVTPYPVEEDEEVCTLGAECELSFQVANDSPALERLADKYIFPMREDNTEVFVDNSVDDSKTLMIVFTKDRHGLVLDVVSVLKALGVRVHRVASSENEALRLILNRTEGELVSVKDLNLTLNNCVAFWITDERSGDKIYDDGQRLIQLITCIKIELNAPYPRPRPAFADRWHRVTVQKNRSDRYTVFSVQTQDRPCLLSTLTSAFAALNIDVASATIKSCEGRVENTFFVTKHGSKCPLSEVDINMALEKVMTALRLVGEHGPGETLWYQVRDGTSCLVGEAIFIDEVNNSELACFKFSKVGGAPLVFRAHCQLQMFLCFRNFLSNSFPFCATVRNAKLPWSIARGAIYTYHS